MVSCKRPDVDYRKACLDAYNLWLPEYYSAHPDVLLGAGMVYMRLPEATIAFKTRHLMIIHRLLGANDFPHFDSTWPPSQEVIRTVMADLAEAEKDLVLHDNPVECYGLSS